MTKQNMIDKIYDTIGDKTLSFGCKVTCFEVDFGYTKTSFIKTFGTFDERYIKPAFCKKSNDCDGLFYDNINIIGHPVLINRVERYLVSVNDYELVRQSLSTDELLLPVEERNEDSIKILYNLINT